MTLLQRLQLVAGWSLILVGLVHSALTFVQYDEFGLSALWFLGSGLFVMLVGGVNVMAGRSATNRAPSGWGPWGLALLANVAGATLAGTFAWITRGEIQGWILLVLFLAGVAALLRGPPRGGEEKAR